MELRFHSSIDDVDDAAWDALAAGGGPFLRHHFLSALERHGAAAPALGWRPHHLVAYRDGRAVGAAPVYIKWSSHGEFVFDWAWAHAYRRNGLSYYPKLLCAVPFTPVTGPRLLATGDDAGDIRRRLAEGLIEETRRLDSSSAHWNFVDDAAAATLAAIPALLARFDWQFHWFNAGYGSFDEFLATLTAKRRKNVRQERRRVAEAGVTIEVIHGNEADSRAWTDAHGFYRRTFEEKGNIAVLSRALFVELGETLGRDIVLMFACRHGRRIAGAVYLRDETRLYGRYWGSDEFVDALHFELCYYAGIDYAIAHGLSYFEPGAQGEHKFLRGFEPVRTRSYHYIADSRFRAAIADYLEREATVLGEYRNELAEHSAYRSEKPAEHHRESQ